MGGRIAVLMGGPSAEHDVSMRSGAQVLSALADDAFGVRIDRDGTWNVGERAVQSVGAALDLLGEIADVVFIALHGPFGEDGIVQALLEAKGIPYTGSGVAASGLAMDKYRSKLAYRAAGLPTPEFLLADGRVGLEALATEAEARLGLPCVIKPLANGSSFGVSFPADRDDLVAAVGRLLEEGHEVLIEKKVRGREFTCGVLATDGAHSERALPVTEIIPSDAYAFFDYEAKYTPGATLETTPAEIPLEVAGEIQRIALEAHRVLGCRDFSRSDFMLEGGRPLLLETNTIPGLTAQSLLPQEAAAAGIEFPALVRILVENARKRRK